MDVRHIAEMIILQSIEDMWNQKEMKGCTDFFQGEGFTLCAGLAGLDEYDQRRLLNMVRKTNSLINPDGAFPAATRLRRGLSGTGRQDKKISAGLGPR